MGGWRRKCSHPEGGGGCTKRFPQGSVGVEGVDREVGTGHQLRAVGDTTCKSGERASEVLPLRNK